MRIFRTKLVRLALGAALVTFLSACNALGGYVQLAPGVPAGWNDCPYGLMIHQVWHWDQSWAQQIAWRESRCDPSALNPSGSAGLFQLLGHQDLLNEACPGHADWRDPYCNTEAAWLLYERDGRAPWNL